MTTLPLYLYLDLESLPSQDPAVMREIIAKHATEPLDESTIKPAANLTDPAKIAADLEKRLEKARGDQVALVDKAAKATDEEYRRTALDATTGHIACISAAIGDGAVFNVRNDAFSLFQSPGLEAVLKHERGVIEDFFVEVEAMLSQLARNDAEAEWARMEEKVARMNEAGLAKAMPPNGREAWVRAECIRFSRTPTVVAHHAQFDIRYIWQRCIILGVPVPSWWPVDAKPWDTSAIDDTMLAWAGAKGTIGLDRLCRALGIPGKPADIDGSKVLDAVREGRIDDVCRYCDGDVERLRSVHRHIRGITGPTEILVTGHAAEILRSLEEPGSFVNLQMLGEEWTEAERDELFAAADAAADRIHGRVQEGGAA